MDEPTLNSVLKELHADLARRYKTHSTKIEKIWRSLDKNQRANCFRAGAAEGVVLKTSTDESMGNHHLIIPELNLSDIAEHGPDYLLDLMKHRATTTLREQYCGGVNDGAGDFEVIMESMHTKGLCPANSLPNCFTLFTDETGYGDSYELVVEDPSFFDPLKPSIDDGFVVPQSIGDLILQGQSFLVQSLNVFIENILNQISKKKKSTERPTNSKKLGLATSSKPPPQSSTKASTPDLALDALDQKTSFEEYLDLLSTEPSALARAVSREFFSQPELLMDERGRQLPVYTDSHISSAFFEIVRKANNASAIWDYTRHLLKLLEDSKSKVYRAVILQELSNVCHFEYERAKSIFKRYVQSETGSKFFCRRNGVRDPDGGARVTVKQYPESLALADPQIYYLLCLCQPKTDASEAIQWLEKLGNLHHSHPLEREKMEESELDALYDLIRIAELSKLLSRTAPMPPISRKTGQNFISRARNLGTELDKLKIKLDLSKFAVPINQLLEASNANDAFQLLDRLVVAAAGATMKSLHQNLVDESLNDLQKHCQQVLDSTSQAKEILPAFATATRHVEEAPTPEPKQKSKSRPSQPATSESEPEADAPAVQEPIHPQRHEVRPSTATVFSSLFTKSQARSPVDWTDFVAAMADIGFSVEPKYGSVFTFSPPDSMQPRRSLTLHRPHKSEIEGFRTLIIARRLKRSYGWDEETFVAI